MSSTEWLVAIAGLSAIAWINWYFFFAERRTAVARPYAGIQEVEIEVKGGYDPGLVRLKRGVPARLIFNRRETSSCSEEVVFPAFGVRKFLPAHEKTALEVTPPTPGTYDFTCGMGMLHGRLVAE
jgi:plastocyanin domain-containing protein